MTPDVPILCMEGVSYYRSYMTVHRAELILEMVYEGEEKKWLFTSHGAEIVSEEKAASSCVVDAHWRLRC